MRASSKHPRVESSSGAPPPPPPPSLGDPTTEEYVDPTTAVDPPPTFSSIDAYLRSMLETVMTVQAAQGQILVDVLTELQALCANLASSRCSPLSSFDDKS